MSLPDAPQKPLSLIRKGAIPAVLLAALTSPLAYKELERWEGNILHAYKDRLAYNIPTRSGQLPDEACPYPVVLPAVVTAKVLRCRNGARLILQGATWTGTSGQLRGGGSASRLSAWKNNQAKKPQSKH